MVQNEGSFGWAGAVSVLLPPSANASAPVIRMRRSSCPTWRNQIERLCSELKDWQRVVARCGKTAASYIDFIGLTCSPKLYQS